MEQAAISGSTARSNLFTGMLDNEMVVTLPVSSSLPWYAAYLGFVNPIAAGAVLRRRTVVSQSDRQNARVQSTK